MIYKEIHDFMYPDPLEDVIVLFCDKCGGEIYEGGEYMTYEGENICEDCYNSFMADDWLELIGAKKQTAEKER